MKHPGEGAGRRENGRRTEKEERGREGERERTREKKGREKERGGERKVRQIKHFPICKSIPC